MSQHCLLLGPVRNRAYYVLGILHQLDVTHQLNDYQFYIGGSSSAIINLLLCCGLRPIDVAHELINSKVFDLLNLNMPQVLRATLEPILKNLFGIAPTLQQLHDITGNELYIPTYNETLDKKEYLSHISYPHMECIAACACAMTKHNSHYKQTYCGSTYTDCSHCESIPIVPEYDRSMAVTCIYVAPREHVVNEARLFIPEHWCVMKVEDTPSNTAMFSREKNQMMLAGMKHI